MSSFANNSHQIRLKRPMFLTRILPLLIGLFTLFSCEQSKTEEAVPVDHPLPSKLSPSKTDPPKENNPTKPLSFADTVEKTRPAVVNIYTQTLVKTKRYRFYGGGLIPEKRRSQSLGSGFLISKDGYVLTNNHVVDKATKIEVRLFDERVFVAKVIGTDSRTDIALLKLDAKEDLPFLTFENGDTLRVGDWVIAIGNPLGLTSTVTAGIVSAEGRKNSTGNALGFQDFIQTDASINPGNSGGPLLALSGKIVGMNTAINPEGQGLGFAIPTKMILEILPRLKKGGALRRSSLGIIAGEVPEALGRRVRLRKEGGALVRKVEKGGPSDRAGLRPGDIILSLGGKQIRSRRDLAWKAGNIGIGKRTTIVFQRTTSIRKTSITMGVLGK